MLTRIYVQRKAAIDLEVTEKLVRDSVARRQLLLQAAAPILENAQMQSSGRQWFDSITSFTSVIPREAVFYPYNNRVRSCFTVQQISDEYYGSQTEVGSKDLEKHWGEGKAGIRSGYSWRSKKARLEYTKEPCVCVTSIWSKNAAM